MDHEEYAPYRREPVPATLPVMAAGSPLWLAYPDGELAPLLQLWVDGVPRPKGSMKNVAERGKAARLIEDNPRSAAWRQAMQDKIGTVTGFGRGVGWPVARAVDVQVVFLFERGPTHGAEEAIPGDDLDKLARNVLDALQSAGAIANDRQVVGLVVGKAWISPVASDVPGAMITLMEAR
jgi:hypothetical protein